MKTSTPISPPSGPAQWLFQGPSAKSKLLANDMKKATKTVIVALGLLMGGLAQAKVFDDFSSGNLMDNWSTTSTDTGLKWTIEDGVLAFSSASAHPGTATYVSRKQDFKLVGTPEKPLVVFIELPETFFSKQALNTGQHEAFTFGVRDSEEQSMAGTINFTATEAGLSGNIILSVTGASPAVNWSFSPMHAGDKLLLTWDGSVVRFLRFDARLEAVHDLTLPVRTPEGFRFANDTGALFMTYASRQGTPAGDGRVALAAIGVAHGASFATNNPRSADGTLELLEVRKIWNEAPHNGFTGLARFNDQWFVSFREGEKHEYHPSGQLRIIRSRDEGQTWETVALKKWDGGDVPEAGLSITANGELMVTGLVNVGGNRFQSTTWLSADGENWRGPFVDEENNPTWRWRTEWHEGYGYSVAYSGIHQPKVALYRTADGKSWELVSKDMGPPTSDWQTEAHVVFANDGTGYCLLRQDCGAGNDTRNTPTGYIGTAAPPYTEWSWQPLGRRIGGPFIKLLPDGRLLSVMRLHESFTGHQTGYTALVWIDPETGSLTEALRLPSGGGDTSYAGVVLHEGVLWISYYSRHGGKTEIYLAKVALGDAASN